MKRYGTIMVRRDSRNLEVEYYPMLDKYLSQMEEGMTVEINGSLIYILQQTAKRCFLVRIAMTGELCCFGPYCHRSFVPEDPFSKKTVFINPALAEKLFQRARMSPVLVNFSCSFDWDI